MRHKLGSNQYRTQWSTSPAATNHIFGALMQQAAHSSPPPPPPQPADPEQELPKGERQSLQAAALRECKDPLCTPSRLVQLLREWPTPKLVLTAAQHMRANGQVLQEVTDQAIKRQRRSHTNAPIEYQQARVAVLRHPECPWTLLEKEMKQALTPVYVLAAVRNPQWGSYALEMVRKNPYKPAYLRAILSGKLPIQPQREHWEAAVGSNSHTTRESAAAGPGLPHDLAAQLVHDSKPAVRSSLAHNPNLPVELAIELMGTERSGMYPAATKELASNPKCPPEALAVALGHSHPEVRQAALNNPNLPEEYRALGRVASRR